MYGPLCSKDLSNLKENNYVTFFVKGFTYFNIHNIFVCVAINLQRKQSIKFDKGRLASCIFKQKHVQQNFGNIATIDMVFVKNIVNLWLIYIC